MWKLIYISNDSRYLITGQNNKNYIIAVKMLQTLLNIFIEKFCKCQRGVESRIFDFYYALRSEILIPALSVTSDLKNQ